MELSTQVNASTLVSALSASHEITKMLLAQDPVVFEALVQQMVPKQTKTLQKYANEIDQISKQTGFDILELAKPLSQDPLTLRQDQATHTQESNIPAPDFDVSEFQKQLNQDKQKAKKMIDDLVAQAKATKQEFLKEYADKPLHPYEQMLHQYLGKDFKPKPIEEMPVDPDVDPIKVVAHITELSRSLQEKSMKQVRMIVDQALDTTFPGITSEALGTAFAVLSGNEFTVDHKMTARHLEFCENLRNISVEYVIAHPYEAAKRILSEFMRVGYAF